MEMSLQNMSYLIAVFCCKASFSSLLATRKWDLENKTSFQSLLLLRTSDFLSVPAMAINFLSYLKKAFGDCILLPIWNKLHLKVI